VKRIQCTKCRQVFWTELKVDEALIGSGEWIQSPCPICGADWAVVEPVTRRPRAVGRRKARLAVRRRVRPRKAAPPAEEKAPVFSPVRIRSLRRKLGLTQKELAAITSVSLGAVANWEKGKFKPKKDKMTQLTELAKLGKEDVKNLLAQKMTKQQEEKKTEEAQGEKAKGKTKERARKKPAPSPKK